MNLLLIGLRASGKSSVARAVAPRLGLAHVDLDELAPRVLGFATPAEVFRGVGEPAFRDAERRVLSDALRADGQVIALGGGTPMVPGVADAIREAQRDRRAHVVYLLADAGTLRDRLRATNLADRPGLLGPDPLAEIEALLSDRDPLYRDLADEVIEVGPLDLDQVCGEVVLSYIGVSRG